MDCTTALLVVAIAGLIFMAIGIYAALHQAKWMAQYDDKNKESKQ